MIGQDPYYGRPEVSNSDLSALKNYFMPRDYVMDATAAYRFGNLIDARITEKHRVNHYTRQIDNESFTHEEWEKATEMEKAFISDPQCAELLKLCSGQNVMAGPVLLTYQGLEFDLTLRCKYDLWASRLGWGADIKSTTATTQKQFEEAVRHFDYDRQRAVYMTLSGAKKDMLIGISKVNYKIFKINITRESDLFKSGMEKFEELAFRYWSLFGNINQQ